jgi:prepilin-type processing-associated H-X9-DG protein
MSPNDGGPSDSYKITFLNRVVYVEGDPERLGKYTRVNQWREPAKRGLVYEVINAYGIEMAIGYLYKWPWKPENANGADFPVDAQLGAAWNWDFNRHGRRAIGNKPSDPSMNMLYCDGHADTVSNREAYRTCRFR